MVREGRMNRTKAERTNPEIRWLSVVGVAARNVLTLLHDQAKDVAAENRAVSAAVEGIGAVVSKDEKLAGPTFEKLIFKLGGCKGLRSYRQVGLSKFLTVYIDHAVCQVNRIACDGHNSLYCETAVEGVSQNNNFCALWRPEVQHPAVE